ncbi:MAG TPA: cytochrome c oxidase subunit 3 [Edaphocola sp.]|nr:cytochrome c oxidase subunit 3 [Edaphocola sp.]
MENKLMIKLVVGTEALFFVALIFGYVYFAFKPGYDPRVLRLLHTRSTGIFSLFLFSSSFTFWRAAVNFDKGKPSRLKVWLAITIALGCLFLFGQGREYFNLFRENLTISSNLFGTSFFTLTGFHGLHVFIGLIMLSIVLLLAFLGDLDRPGSSVIETVGIYWHFVDVVWFFVFSLVYVLPHFLK